jgi:hypothetical protein
MRRSVGLSLILTLITCGIYGIYWFIVLTNDVGRLSGDTSFTGGKHFLLTLITCGIWSFVWSYQLGKNIAAAQERMGFRVTDNSVIYLVLNIFGLGIVNYALAQSEVNRLVEAY